MNKIGLLILSLIIVGIISCEKQDSLTAIPADPLIQSFIRFREDTIAVNLAKTAARKESIGAVWATAIEGKMPDTVLNKNSLIIRVTGDSARLYTKTEILATYTDSAGFSYSSNTADTLNQVTLTKVEKKKNGIVEGSFTIRVSNSTKTKTLILNEGKISTAFVE